MISEWWLKNEGMFMHELAERGLRKWPQADDYPWPEADRHQPADLVENGRYECSVLIVGCFRKPCADTLPSLRQSRWMLANERCGRLPTEDCWISVD